MTHAAAALPLFAVLSHVVFYVGAQLAADELEWQRDIKGPWLDDTLVWTGRLLLDAALAIEGKRLRYRFARDDTLAARLGVAARAYRGFALAAAAAFALGLALDGHFRREIFGISCAAHWFALGAGDQIGSAGRASFVFPHLWYASAVTRATFLLALLPPRARPAAALAIPVALLDIDTLRDSPAFFPCMLEGRGCMLPHARGLDAASHLAWVAVGFVAGHAGGGEWLAGAGALAPHVLPRVLAVRARAIGSLALAASFERRPRARRAAVAAAFALHMALLGSVLAPESLINETLR